MKTLLLVLLLSFNNAFAISDKELIGLFKENNFAQVELSKFTYDNSKLKSIIVNLNKTALELSNIWSDTILEGDYALLSSPRLEKKSIVVLLHKGAAVGFVSYVSAKAAYSGECLRDETLPADVADAKYNECLKKYKGRISERFLSNIKGDHVENYREEVEFQSEI